MALDRLVLLAFFALLVQDTAAVTAPSDVAALQGLYTAFGSLPGNFSQWLSKDPCNDPLLGGPVYLVNCSTATDNNVDPVTRQPYRVITGLQLANAKNLYPKNPTAYPLLYGGVLPTQIGAFQYLDNLLLTDMNLRVLPDSLGALQNLQQLWVDGNSLTGLPPSIFTLQKLTTLSLNGNRLQELLPAVGNLTNLARLDVSYNPWSKPFPGNLGNLPRLVTLVAQTANLTTSFGNGLPVFPAWLWQIKSLGSIILDYNPGFGAVIPSDLGTMYNLGYFSATGSNLTGPIPASIGKLPYIGALRLSNNQLNGSIPVELGNLTTYLHTVELDHNQLSGPIPTEVASLRTEVLDLSYNKLSGPFPLALANATGIINISFNNLTGPLPSFLLPAPGRTAQFNYTGNPWCSNVIGAYCPSVGQAQALQIIKAAVGNPPALATWQGTDPCQKWTGVTCSNGTVTAIDLTNAGLKGAVPVEVFYLKDVQTLKLSGNLLSGAIPDSVANLTNLNALYLDRNNLTGGIPASLANLTNLQVLNVSGNALSGALPAFLSKVPTAEYGNQRGAGFCNSVPGTPCVTVATTAPVTTAPVTAVPVISLPVNGTSSPSAASTTTGGTNATLPVVSQISGAYHVQTGVLGALVLVVLSLVS